MKQTKLPIFGLSLLILSGIIYSCNKDSVSPSSIISTGAVFVTSVVQSKFTSAVTISTNGSGSTGSITLKNNGMKVEVNITN